MKLLLTTALAMSLCAGTALAQQAPAAPTPPAPVAPTTPPPELAPDENAAPSAGDQSAEPGDTTPGDEARKHRRDRGERWHRGDRGWRHHARRGARPMPPPRGAHFKVEIREDGQVDVDVRCAANEPMQTCADIMMQMLDRVDPGGSAP